MNFSHQLGLTDLKIHLVFTRRVTKKSYLLFSFATTDRDREEKIKKKKNTQAGKASLGTR